MAKHSPEFVEPCPEASGEDAEGDNNEKEEEEGLLDEVAEEAAADEDCLDRGWDAVGWGGLWGRVGRCVVQGRK